MNQTSTVTISNTSYQVLAELSASSGKPIETVLEQAIEQYQRQQFLAANNKISKYSLDELLASEIESSEEVSWGKPEGEEVW